MTELCNARYDYGGCSLSSRHSGDHIARDGRHFSNEDAAEYVKRIPEAESAEVPMNRHERRAAKKMGKIW